MKELNLHQRLEQELAKYPNLFELFKNDMPYSPSLFVKVYKDVNVEQIWGRHFSFWNVLLHDTDPQFKARLQETDVLVGRYKSAYGEHRLRSGISGSLFSFLSELEVYHAFVSSSAMPIIEPYAAKGSKKKMDLSVNLNARQVLIEVITPYPPEKMLRQVASFAPLDFDLSKKLAYEIVHHFADLSQPSSPTVIIVNGIYSGLDPMILAAALDKLNELTEKDFPSVAPAEAAALSSKGKLFVSAALLYKSNWGPSLVVNPHGASLTESEILSLRKILHLPG